MGAMLLHRRATSRRAKAARRALCAESKKCAADIIPLSAVQHPGVSCTVAGLKSQPLRMRTKANEQRMAVFKQQMQVLKSQGLAFQTRQPTFAKQFDLGSTLTSFDEELESDWLSGYSSSASSSSSSLDGEKGEEKVRAVDCRGSAVCNKGGDFRRAAPVSVFNKWPLVPQGLGSIQE